MGDKPFAETSRQLRWLFIWLLPLGVAVALGLSIGYICLLEAEPDLPSGFVGFTVGILLPLLLGSLISRPFFGGHTFAFRFYVFWVFLLGTPALLSVWLYISTVWFHSPL